MIGNRLFTHVAQHVDAAHVRQHDIEDHRGIVARQRALYSRLAGQHQRGVEAFARQVFAQHGAKLQVIVDQ